MNLSNEDVEDGQENEQGTFNWKASTISLMLRKMLSLSLYIYSQLHLLGLELAGTKRIDNGFQTTERK